MLKDCGGNYIHYAVSSKVKAVTGIFNPLTSWRTAVSSESYTSELLVDLFNEGKKFKIIC